MASSHLCFGTARFLLLLGSGGFLRRILRCHGLSKMNTTLAIDAASSCAQQIPDMLRSSERFCVFLRSAVSPIVVQ